MIRMVLGVEHMVWGCWVRGLHPVYSFNINPSSSLALRRGALPIPALYKSTGYFECKRNKWTAKREEVVDVFGIGNFELLTLTETKLKVNEEVSWCEVNGIIAGAQMEIARESVTVLLNDVGHSAVIDFGCIS